MNKCAYRHCRIEFNPNKANQKYHSDQCRIKEWEILHPRLGKGLDALLPKKTEAGKPHCGHPGRSKRLAQTLNVFYELIKCTTLDIQKRTGSMKPSTDVDDLRRAGYPISMAKYLYTSKEGRKIYQYELLKTSAA